MADLRMTLASRESARTWLYYRNDCISLDFDEVKLNAKEGRRVRAWLTDWFNDTVVAVGGRDHLYRTASRRAFFLDFMTE
jgi:hypothetical protein